MRLRKTSKRPPSGDVARIPLSVFRGLEPLPEPPEPPPAVDPLRHAKWATLLSWGLGWQLATAAIAAWTSPWVWALSEGLLLVCVGGVKPLRVVATLGIYQLWMEARSAAEKAQEPPKEEAR